MTFSGGELTRASLTRALAAEPDLLLLDEPTNHLDTDAIEWLEEHLDGLDAAVVFVSHDRWFLESVATGVLEIERGQGRFDKGSYSHWRRLKAERLAAQADAFERQQGELAHLQRFVDRFRYGTKSRQAQSKLKAMARIERVDRPTEQRALGFRFPAPARSGRVVLEAEGLDVARAGPHADHGRGLRHRARPARRPDRAQRRRQDDADRDAPRPARRRPRAASGSATASMPGYYSQQSLELPDAYRALDAITSGTGLTGPAARDLLGLFLFSGEDVEKPVAALSGGERRRLALARTVVSGANFLVLDEPTNHLDIESREALEDALLGFPGTVLLVSHDRALIEALATRTLAIEDGRLVAREGAFGDYARAHEAARPRGPAAAAKRRAEAGQAAGRASRAAGRAPTGSGARRSGPRARSRRLEREIAAAEERLGAIEARLSQPDAYADDAALVDDGREHQRLQEEIAYLYREWERHAAEAELAHRELERARLGELLVAPGERAGAQVGGDRVHPGQLGGDHRALILATRSASPAAGGRTRRQLAVEPRRAARAARRAALEQREQVAPGPSSIANESAAGNSGNSLRGAASISSATRGPLPRPSSVSS